MKRHKIAKEIENRTLREARLIVENNYTLRHTASVFGVSKSTVHNDMQTRLKDLDRNLYSKVVAILKNNFDNKHIHGGEAMRRKYSNKVCL